ncbi:MAG: thioredoxin, partial [Candidatus Hydrogenedentes bacterium]|nr:thioredoxin [Candidatus Hydrogenedentota bacterium]
MPASVYPTGTTIYDPEKCWNGYTLFRAGGDARLVDMNGNTVNQWQGLGGHPPKMLPGGYVMGSSHRQIGMKYVPWDNSDLVQVDWDGNIV